MPAFKPDYTRVSEIASCEFLLRAGSSMEQTEQKEERKASTNSSRSFSFYDLVAVKVMTKLREPTSCLYLTAGASSHHLVFAF